MRGKPAASICHLYVNSPDHAFDRALKAEAERRAEELTRSGFPFAARVRHSLADERVQWQQIHDDLAAEPRPDLFVIIPINQDAAFDILNLITGQHDDTTCVFLHQRLTPALRAERGHLGNRFFSVGADQAEIGRIQARQLGAILPGQRGDVLYVQGRENSYGTKQRMKGFVEELPRTPEIKLNGYRVFGDWSAEGVRPAVAGWEARGGKLEWIQAAGAQNDDMALALREVFDETKRSIPVIGVDGLEKGRKAVDRGQLAATVVQPLGVGHAMTTFAQALTGELPAGAIPDDGNIVLAPESYPPLEALASATRKT